MTKRLLLRSLLALVALGTVIGSGWILSLPPAPAAGAPSPIPEAETRDMLDALKPPKRKRPVVAIIGINQSTETTDYLMPYGILRRADIADVVALGIGSGPVHLYPALTVMPQATAAAFDARYPTGADYVIVPAMEPDNDPAVLDWIKSQAARGAIIIGVCAGAKVVGNAGLLDGRRATTHWYYLDELRKAHPTIRYVANRRFVVDRGIATTTGISASMPMTLTLIEAIAGRNKAEEVARTLGLIDWDARHDSGAFRITRPFALTVMGNMLAFWNREELGLKVEPGVDEVSLALVADIWSRTYRSRALAIAEDQTILTKGGIRLIVDQTTSIWPANRSLPPIGARKAAETLEQSLRAISNRYGPRTADLVATQLEYPRH